MLSVPTYKLPRKVYIKIARAEKLIASQKDNKKKLNNKYRVVILGGKKKDSTTLVENVEGNPEWNFSCIIKLPRGKSDPVCLVIEDSDGHHKGQVVISPVKIGPKPFNHSPDESPATLSNAICAELEPTNKISTVHGSLIYWIWVDEYYADGDTDSRNSFHKSVSSLFGSKHSVSKPTGSIGNIGSISSLNKPVNHKSALNFLQIKSKKDKTKKSSSNNKVVANSSDIESYMGSGNLFDTNRGGYHTQNTSYGSSDLQFAGHGNHSNGAYERTASNRSFNPLPDRLDILSHGSHGSISESGSSSKYGDAQEYSYGIAPITLPPISSESPGIKRLDGGFPSPSTLLSKINHSNYQNANYHHRDVDQRYQPGHVSLSSSDFSVLSDRSLHQPISSIVRIMNDESDIIRRENADLKVQNSIIGQKVVQLQNELDYVKDTLYKLRCKLLEEGATNFLEKM